VPELPEVETIRKQMEAQVIGSVIQSVDLAVPKVARQTRLEAVVGQEIRQVGRKGKYLLIETTGEKEIVVHLRMTGRLLVRPAEAAPDPYLCVRIVLRKKKAGLELRFCDMWRWGELQVVSRGDYSNIAGLRQLGPDAWDYPWTGAELKARARGRRVPIKAFLLDQRTIGGLGNIYADETLFAAGIRPTSSVDRISLVRFGRVCSEMKKILIAAIASGGTTLRDYRDAAGQPGGFIPKVYGRQDSPCPNCGTIIKRVIVGGRGTAFCPACQTK
jgi:formamidopyrimidine-DNA glycosylase